MDCFHCTGFDSAVFVAAQIAKYLLITAAFTAVGIRLHEWFHR